MMWIIFLIFFAIFSKTVWFFYYFSIYAFEEDKKYTNYNGRVALIVPIFNEDKDKLIDTISNALSATGYNELIFVNDGSSNPDVLNTLKQYQYNNYTIVNMNVNKGKRHAQYEGMKAMHPETDVVVFMDSDTILQPNSIIELLKPMNDLEIGGATACILMKNKNDNFFTKCYAAMFWTASNIWRKGQSNLDFTQVTNGPLSVYRADLLWKLMPQYLTQTFLGVSCRISDDRYLTHHIQIEFNKKVIYVPESIAYTYLPAARGPPPGPTSSSWKPGEGYDVQSVFIVGAKRDSKIPEPGEGVQKSA